MVDYCRILISKNWHLLGTLALDSCIFIDLPYPTTAIGMTILNILLSTCVANISSEEVDPYCRLYKQKLYLTLRIDFSLDKTINDGALAYPTVP